jgi:hypothetical protein
MPIDPTQKPDEQIFNDYSEHMEDVWKEALEDMKVLSSHYTQTANIWADYYARNPDVPRTRPNYHSGIEVALIDQAVDSHLAFEPRFVRNPVGASQQSKDRANRLEKGLNVVFQDAFTAAPNFATKENGKQLVLHNYTQLGVLLDHDALQKPVKKRGEDKEDFEWREWEYMSRKNTWNPFRLVVPAPGEVLMNPLEKTPGIAIWRRKMKAFDLEGHCTTKDMQIKTRNRIYKKDNKTGYSTPFNMSTYDAYDDVEIEEWWTARWHAMKLKDGALLYVEPNGWGIQPFAHAFGGSAITPAGEDFNVKWWIRQALLYRALPTLTMHNQATAGHHAMLMRASWARMGYRHDSAEGAEQLTGQLLQGEEADWWIEKVPQLPGQSFQHKAELESNIERTTYSRMVAGFQAPNVDTATSMVILSENSHRTFRSNVQELEQLYSIAGSNILKLLYRMNGEYGDEYAEIGIGENKLSVRDIENSFYVEAKFEQIDAVVAQQEAQMAMSELDKGLIDKQTYYKVRRYEDPTTIQKGILKDAIYQDPAIIEQGVINALREEGFGEMADRRQAELNAQNLERSTGMPEQAGMTDQGGRPPNPMEPTRPNGNPVQGPSMRPMRRSLPGGMGPAMTQAVRQGGDQL